MEISLYARTTKVADEVQKLPGRLSWLRERIDMEFWENCDVVDTTSCGTYGVRNEFGIVLG